MEDAIVHKVCTSAQGGGVGPESRRNRRTRASSVSERDAIARKHDTVAAFLRSRGCRMSDDDATGWMCSAGAAGDLEQLRRLVINFADPDLADYDSRTALHLAASEGRVKCCAYLPALAGEAESSRCAQSTGARSHV